VTAEDVAKDLEASGLATHIHEALVSAYEQGAAYVRGQLDAVQARYDDICAEYALVMEETNEGMKDGTAQLVTQAYEDYEDGLMDVVHEYARIVGHENIPGPPKLTAL
jgi:DNA-binding ferritin-like protein